MAEKEDPLLTTLNKSIQATHQGVVRLAKAYIDYKDKLVHQEEIAPETLYKSATSYRDLQAEVERLVSAEVTAHVEYYQSGGI